MSVATAYKSKKIEAVSKGQLLFCFKKNCPLKKLIWAWNFSIKREFSFLGIFLPSRSYF
jgi:hypothetical protein